MIAVLFARTDSIYKTMAGVDVYDEARDARTFPGGYPVVAHPPCRTWGCLKAFATAAPAHEHALGPWAIGQVRRWGGVLEHPERSTLWTEESLPPVGTYDEHGGYTLKIDQHWWGHRARKRTLLYICGCAKSDLPAMPLTLTEPTHVVSSGYAKGKHRHRSQKPEVNKAEREATPPAFAEWLVEVARRCNKK